MNKDAFVSGQKTLAILGGGQLGKMLLQCAQTWDINTKVLDPAADAPAQHLTHSFTQGALLDYDTVCTFAKDADVVTIEIEHVNTDALAFLESQGKIVHPKPAALRIIQDKGLQRIFYSEQQLPSPNFQLFDHAAAVRDAIQSNQLSYPFVQKSRKAGYDGKGVVLVRDEKDLAQLLDTDCVCEDLVDLATEISIIAVRNAKDEVVCYDPVQMDVHSDANLLDELVFPASVDSDIANKAKELAAQIIRAFDICGLLAVEFFVSKNKELLINEVAPRPHNSGHQTIESCITSQYENHIRGILNFPLGSTKIIQPSVMINVLGEPGFAGPVVYEGLDACLAEEGIKVHIYGKKETRPMRKMGHITIIAPTVEAAKQKAKWVKQTLKVKA